MATIPRAVQPRATVPSFTGRAPALLLSALLLSAVAAVGLFQVLQTSRAATIGYELRALERERSELSAEIRLVEAEIARIARVEGVREQAVERLGMVVPERTVRIDVPVAAPAVVPMPERYVEAATPAEILPLAWWERVLGRFSAFN